jgi:hypothetical protein
MRNFFLFIIILSASLQAAVPSTISWQGVLTDEDGNLLDGNYEITVNIYDSDMSMMSLWSETHNLMITDGLVNITLGIIEPLELDFTVQYWLGLSINDGDELPLVELNSVPYAITAKNVEDRSITYGKLQDAVGNNGTFLIWDGAEWNEGTESDPELYVQPGLFNFQH